SVPYFILGIIWIAVAAALVPSQLDKPSDCFLTFYILFVFISGSSLWPASGMLGLPGAATLLIFLATPAIALRFSEPVCTRVLRSYCRGVLIAKIGTYRMNRPGYPRHPFAS